MTDQQLLGVLTDKKTLVLAYAASSAYVMREAFRAIKEFEGFKGRADLAPEVAKRLGAMVGKERDSVILGAHLYALELTGARRDFSGALLRLLKEPRIRGNAMIGQFAGHQALGLLGGAAAKKERANPDALLEPNELEAALEGLAGEGGRE